MKLNIIGLGKLGFPMALFLRSKFELNAFDTNREVRDIIKNNAKLYLPNETNIKKYLKKKINVSNSIEESLIGTSISFIIVPTPSKKNGKFSNEYLLDVLDKICIFLKKYKQKKPYIININSTVSPGSFKNELIPFMKKNGLQINKDYDFIYNPYFVALGDVIKNLEFPDFILLGHASFSSLGVIQNLYKKIYKNPRFKSMSLEESELVKLLVNCYVASKISFTNFVKDISEKINKTSVNKILDAIGSDNRIGNKFLRPGGPFLGPCLPRDITALTKFCNEIKINTYYPNATKRINKNTSTKLLRLIKILKNKKIKSIGFTGLGYKPNTDFFEESIAYKLMIKAKKIGIKVYFFDRYIKNSNMNFTRVYNLKDLNKNSEIIFISYEDKYISKNENIFNNKVIIWDIFNFIKNNKIKKFSNKNKINYFI